MFKTVRMTRHLSAAGAGGSKAQVFTDDADAKYVVKFKENQQGTRVLVNELVASGIGQELGVPMPEGVLANISAELLGVNPSLASHNGRPVTAGLHFGTAFVEDPMPVPRGKSLRTLLSDVENLADYPIVIVFDILVLNHDRNNEGNFLVPSAGKNGALRRFVAIDHGHCFGNPTWGPELATKVGTWPPSLLPETLALVTGQDPFAAALLRLKSLTDDSINSIVDHVPAEWGLPAPEAEALKSFLRGQRDKLPEILAANRAHFPNWQ